MEGQQDQLDDQSEQDQGHAVGARQVVEQTAANDEMDDYVKAYSSMKPKEAAAIFDTMTDNLQLVADILDSMDAQSRANILGKMDAATAAKVTAIMEPVE